MILNGKIKGESSGLPLLSALRNVTNNIQPSGDDAMLSRTVTLANDDIIALPNTPFVLVDSPGSGKTLVPFSIVFSTNTVVVYSNINTSAVLYVKLGNQVVFQEDADNYAYPVLNAYGTDSVIGILSPVSLPVEGHVMGAGSVEYLRTGLEDVGIALGHTNGTNFTGGDPANTLKVTIYYAIADL